MNRFQNIPIQVSKSLGKDSSIRQVASLLLNKGQRKKACAKTGSKILDYLRLVFETISVASG